MAGRNPRVLVLDTADEVIEPNPPPAPKTCLVATGAYELSSTKGWPSPKALGVECKLVPPQPLKMQYTEGAAKDLLSQHGLVSVPGVANAAVSMGLVQQVIGEQIDAKLVDSQPGPLQYDGKKPDLSSMLLDIYQVKKMMGSCLKMLNLDVPEVVLEKGPDITPPILLNQHTLADLQKWGQLGIISKKTLVDAIEEVDLDDAKPAG